MWLGAVVSQVRRPPLQRRLRGGHGHRGVRPTSRVGRGTGRLDRPPRTAPQGVVGSADRVPRRPRGQLRRRVARAIGWRSSLTRAAPRLRRAFDGAPCRPAPFERRVPPEHQRHDPVRRNRNDDECDHERPQHRMPARHQRFRQDADDGNEREYREPHDERGDVDVRPRRRGGWLGFGVRHGRAVIRRCGCHLGLRNRGKAAGGGRDAQARPTRLILLPGRGRRYARGSAAGVQGSDLCGPRCVGRGIRRPRLKPRSRHASQPAPG